MKVLIVCDGEHEDSGALRSLVERLVGCSLEVTHRRGKAVERRLQGKGGKLYKKALSIVLDAQDEGFDAVVFLVDEDDDSDRAPQLTRAQEVVDQTFSSRRAFGVAIRTFDAWMLADQVALSNALNRTIQQLPDPEHEPDPKTVAARLLAGSPQVNLSQRQLYARLAACFDLEILRQRCPKGFVPFANRVVTLRQGTT